MHYPSFSAKIRNKQKKKTAWNISYLKKLRTTCSRKSLWNLTSEPISSATCGTNVWICTVRGHYESKKKKTIKRKNRKRNKKVGTIVEYIFQFSNLATKTGDFVVEVDAGIDMQLDFIGGCNGSGAKPLSAILANSIHAKLNILCKERERERVKNKPGSVRSSIAVKGGTSVRIGRHWNGNPWNWIEFHKMGKNEFHTILISTWKPRFRERIQFIANCKLPLCPNACSHLQQRNLSTHSSIRTRFYWLKCIKQLYNIKIVIK